MLGKQGYLMLSGQFFLLVSKQKLNQIPNNETEPLCVLFAVMGSAAAQSQETGLDIETPTRKTKRKPKLYRELSDSRRRKNPKASKD